ncbi:MAG: lmo0937 family membrane protein [Acidobacteriota bacterium]
MFTALIAVLVIAWLVGMVTSYTAGGFIHVLLVAALILLLLKMFRDRRPFAEK